MAIELRKKNGRLLPFLYGRYYLNKRARVINTGIRWQGTPPASMRERGDATFEASRRRAEAVLQRHRAEARAAADRSRHNTASPDAGPYPSPTLREMLERMRVADTLRHCASSWATWKRGLLEDFVTWAEAQALQTPEQISRSVAQAYLDRLRAPDASGRRRTAKTLRTMKTVLTQAFALVSEPHRDNPFKALCILPERGDRVVNRTPLDGDEIRRLLQAAESDPLACDLIVTGLSTGLRRGDVCRLRWEQVDLDRGALRLVAAKTGVSLTLPILPRLREVLERRAGLRAKGCLYVFPEAEALLRDNPGGITWRVKKVFVRAFATPEQLARGITAAIKSVTQSQRRVGVRAASTYDFHALRTSFVTLAISGGVSLDKVRALTGHKTVDLVLRHYFKPKASELAADLARALPEVLTGSAPAGSARGAEPAGS
jgi:integrase